SSTIMFPGWSPPRLSAEVPNLRSRWDLDSVHGRYLTGEGSGRMVGATVRESVSADRRSSPATRSVVRHDRPVGRTGRGEPAVRTVMESIGHSRPSLQENH